MSLDKKLKSLQNEHFEIAWKFLKKKLGNTKCKELLFEYGEEFHKKYSQYKNATNYIDEEVKFLQNKFILMYIDLKKKEEEN